MSWCLLVTLSEREQENESEQVRGYGLYIFGGDTNKSYGFMEEHIVISLCLMVNILYYIYLAYVNLVKNKNTTTG